LKEKSLFLRAMGGMARLFLMKEQAAEQNVDKNL
jgi:hypothetical protein